MNSLVLIFTADLPLEERATDTCLAGTALNPFALEKGDTLGRIFLLYFFCRQSDVMTFCLLTSMELIDSPTLQ